MNDAICFADAELPFHVWVRERTGEGYRWVLREAPGATGEGVPPSEGLGSGQGGAEGPSPGRPEA